MKSKTSFFNAGLFKNLLKRFWPLWFAYFAIWFIGLPLVTLVQSSTEDASAVESLVGSYSAEINTDILYNLDSLLHFAIISVFIMAICTAAAVFGFLFNTRSTGMVASMPISRNAVFTSAYLAGLVPVVSATFLIAVFNILFSLGGTGLSVSSIIRINMTFFGACSMEFVVFYGIAVLTAMMTGNNYAMPVLYAIFNFLFVGMEQIVGFIYGQFVYGYNADFTSHLDFTSPFIYFFEKINNISSVGFIAKTRTVSQVIEGWGTLIIYCALGIVLAVIALLMFRRRRMESAGDVIAVKALRPVFKYGVTVCVALCFGLLFYSIVSWDTNSRTTELILLALGYIIGAFIGYFASQMMLKKSLHVFRGSLTGCIVISVLCIAFAVCCVFDVLGLGNTLPDADDVYSVTLWSECTFSSEEDVEKILEINRSIIDNRDKYSELDPTDYESVFCVEFSYMLKDGSVIRRYYEISNDENYAAYSELMNSNSAIKAYYSWVYKLSAADITYANLTDYNNSDYFSSEITSRQAYELCKAFEKDIESGVVVSDFNLPTDANPVYELGLDIDVVEGSALAESGGLEVEQCSYYYFSIYPEYTNCIAWINENLAK